MTMKNTKKRWVVIYTRPKWEKKVDYLIKQRGVEAFCPLVKTRKKWADRIKTVELPLFDSYLFARVDANELLSIKQTSGVVDLVYHCGVPAEITDEEIRRVRLLISQNIEELESVSFDQVSIGDRIKVKEGVLSDWQGEIITIKGKSVVMVLEQFNCALVAKINVCQANMLPAF